jgi:hypothetical protein
MLVESVKTSSGPHSSFVLLGVWRASNSGGDAGFRFSKSSPSTTLFHRFFSGRGASFSLYVCGDGIRAFGFIQSSFLCLK